MQSATERRQDVLYYISDRRRVTYQEIADEFGVSFNTARRDVELLACSYPIDHRCGIRCGLGRRYAAAPFLDTGGHYARLQDN